MNGICTVDNAIPFKIILEYHVVTEVLPKWTNPSAADQLVPVYQTSITSN